MNIREALLAEHSKTQTDKIVRHIGDDKKRFDVLMQLFLKDEYRVCQRAAWVVSNCGESHPEWIKTYFPLLLINLEADVHPAVIRNTIRLFQFVEIPKRYHGKVADLCFNYLSDPAIPVAIRVFSMTVLSDLAQIYPELKNELKLVIEALVPHASAGIKSRLKRIKL